MTLTSTSSKTAAADWSGLQKLVKGRVFLPGSPGFRVNSELDNKRYRDRRPAAVFSANGLEDVRTAIRWARDHGIDLVTRTGGHSFAGYSVNDGLVLDLSRLAFASADEDTGLVTVGGGTRVGQIYDVLQPYEMAFATGSSPRIGIAGLSLGGGCGFASRKLGLTQDAMVETTVVMADGSVLRCSERENADLFWACRGAGGGNFGVHTSFVFQARPVPDVTTFALTWRWSDAVAVLSAIQQVLSEAPDEFSVRMGVSASGVDPAEIRDNRVVNTIGQYLGPSHELTSLLEPVLAVAKPLTRQVTDRTYWEANKYMIHPTSGESFALRANYAKEPLPDTAFEEIRGWVGLWPGSTNADGGGIGIFACGGQINRVDPAATSFVHRDTFLLASLDTSWTRADPPDQVAANLRWLNDFRDAMQQYLSGSSYQNFPDPELENWAEAYYGANYPRLVEVKRKYDPDNVFRYEQSIGSDK